MSQIWQVHKITSDFIMNISMIYIELHDIKNKRVTLTDALMSLKRFKSNTNRPLM